MRNFAYASLALLLLTSTARAQDFEAAAKHFGAAQEAFGKRFYQTAAVEFQAAFEITKDPILLYNIGEAWQKAGEGRKAVSSYRAYLKAQPAAQDRADVTKRLKLIEAKKYKIASESAPGDKEAAIAAVEPPLRVEAPPPAPIEPAPAPAPMASQPPPLNSALPPSPEPEPLKTAEPAKTGILDELPATKMRIVAWVGVAVTVAVLTAGAIFGLAAQSRSDEISRRFSFVDSTGQPMAFDMTAQSDYQNLKSEGQLYNGMAIGFFAAAGALAIVTTVLFIVDYKHKKAERKSAMRNIPRIGPTFGKNAGGLASWSF